MNRILSMLLGVVTMFMVFSIVFIAFFSHHYIDVDLRSNLKLLNHCILLGLLVFYFIFLFVTDYVPKGKKALWAVVLLLGSYFAMPFFWYSYIFKSKQNSNQKME